MARPRESDWDVVARPGAIAAAGVVAGVVLATGAPVALAVVLAVAAWVVWAVAAARSGADPARGRGAGGRRASRPRRRDRPRSAGAPATVADRWERAVHDADEASARFAEAAEEIPGGPLRERLDDMCPDVGRSVARAAGLAHWGRELEATLAELDEAEARRLLKRLPEGQGGALAREALEEQLATGARVRADVADAYARLVAINARLDDAAARAVQLAARAHDDATAHEVGTSALVRELDVLRQALDEVRDPRDPGDPGDATG